jgi:hypothetical protein
VVRALLYNESLFAAVLVWRINIGELGRFMEGRHSKMAEQEMAIKRHSNLK